jgi:hypothetical protein
MNRRRIRTMTKHGKSSTMPNGIEMDEFLFNLIRRLKNANLGIMRPFSREVSSMEGRAGEAGMRFARFCMNPMGAEGSRRRLQVRGKTFLDGWNTPARVQTPQDQPG